MRSSYWNPNIKRLCWPGFRVEIIEKFEPISADSQESTGWARGEVSLRHLKLYLQVRHGGTWPSKGRWISVISKANLVYIELQQSQNYIKRPRLNKQTNKQTTNKQDPRDFLKPDHVSRYLVYGWLQSQEGTHRNALILGWGWGGGGSWGEGQ